MEEKLQHKMEKVCFFSDKKIRKKPGSKKMLKIMHEGTEEERQSRKMLGWFMEG